MDPTAPVLTIDGPSGSGKGTISRIAAQRLGWHYLDSGALYRAVGLAAAWEGLDLSDPDAIARAVFTDRIMGGPARWVAAETSGGKPSWLYYFSYVGSRFVLGCFRTAQRRRSRWNGVINFLVLCGLIIPPAVVPTVWVLQSLGLFKTLTGLIFIEIAFGLAFCILLFRAFISTIPRVSSAAITVSPDASTTGRTSAAWLALSIARMASPCAAMPLRIWVIGTRTSSAPTGLEKAA